MSSGFRLEPNHIKQHKNANTQSLSNYLKRIKAWIGFTVFDPAQVGLKQACLFSEHNLAQSCFDSKLSNYLTKIVGYGWFHPANYPRYALIHIYTNSYIRFTQHKGSRGETLGRYSGAVITVVGVTNG